MNIRSHVPVVLDVAEPNHAEWRCFFDSVIGKFGLAAHVAVPPTRRQRRDQEWMMVDQCIISWLYNSVSRDVLDFARAPDATAYKVWERIDDMFRDNQLHRAVYLEAEFRGLYQGDMTIGQYTARLKQLADDKFSHDGAGDDRLAAHGLNVSVLSAPACTSFQGIWRVHTCPRV